MLAGFELRRSSRKKSLLPLRIHGLTSELAFLKSGTSGFGFDHQRLLRLGQLTLFKSPDGFFIFTNEAGSVGPEMNSISPVAVRAQEAVVVSTHDTEIVSALRLAIAEHVGPDRFDLWLAGTELTLVDGTVQIVFSHAFQLEWTRKNLHALIVAACGDVLGRCASIELSLVAATTDGRSGSATQRNWRTGESGGAAAVSGSDATPVADTIVPVTSPTVVPQRAVPQRAGSGRKFRALDSFVLGQSNRLARASADMILNSPGEVSPLFIHGPTGVGKSHLLEGIWTAMRRSPEKRRCVYLTAEQFTSYFLESLHGRGLPSFRRRYRDLDMLIIEDVQFLIGKTATITEFQYTIDALLREGRQLVLSADRNPAALSKLGTEVTTRLAGGLITYLPPPDRQLRVDILDRMARDRGLEIGGDVLGLIADHLTEDARVMSGALNRLQAASLAWGERITMNLATKTLEELFLSNCCTVQLDDIQRVVCDVFGVDSRDLRSNCRARQMTYPRMLAMWLARKHTRAVLSEIGEYFGNRSHSTVISAEKRVAGWMHEGLIVRLPDCDCRVEEAVRRIESKLRAS